MTARQHDVLTEHFRAQPGVQLAFLFAGVSRSQRHLDLTVRDVRLVDSHELIDGGRRGLELSDPARRDIFSYAARAGHAVIEAHVHGAAGTRVTFSRTDTVGETAFVPYVRGKLPGTPYGAMVWATDGVDAHLWLPDSPRRVPVDCIRIVGTRLLELIPTSARYRADPSHDATRYHRQILAFGVEGQRRLRAASVAIVGLGGVGSHVAQQLAYLGIGTFVLTDHDRVEASNLNRLIGASPADLGQLKVGVAMRLINTVLPEATVKAFPVSLATTGPLAMLRTVDLVVGCTDSDGSRLILNEFAKAYLVPYIDCGVGIAVKEDGRIESIGGRVITVLPDGPCLLCAREIDRRIALEELESDAERGARKRAGYVAGENVPGASVVALDGVVASLAANEIIALLTGWREPVTCQTYYGDGRAHPFVSRVVRRDAGCVVCATGLGKGDAANMGRYCQRTLPNDLPM